MRAASVLQRRKHSLWRRPNRKPLALLRLRLSPLPPGLTIPGKLHSLKFPGLQNGDEGRELVEAGRVPGHQGGGGEDGDELGKVWVGYAGELAGDGVPCKPGL